MLASHRLRHREVRKIVDSAGFLLSNKCGGFVHFSERPRSRYEGLFFQLNGRLYRTIADIGIEGEVKEISNKFYRAERILTGNRETFFMPFDRNSVSYELDYLNIAPLLKASGLPLYSADRDERHPLVIAGGP